MAVGFPPDPVYPFGIDSDTTLYLVYNTTESPITADNPPWSDEVEIVPVAADADEIWANNGFANLDGELFYYDAVEKDINGKVYKLKRCARNLGGKHTKFTKAGTYCRGFVVSEHHNQLVTTLIRMENFIGEDFSTDHSTLDWRIRNLQATPVIFDDFTCPDINFIFNIISDDPSSGTLVQYDVQITGKFTQFRLDFGDGTFTTSQLSGQHQYATNSAIDPIVTLSNSKCQVIQSPIERDNPVEPPPPVDQEPLTIPLPEVPTIPVIIPVSLIVPDVVVNTPPILLPDINIGPIGPIGPISIGPIYISVPSTISVIAPTFSPISIVAPTFSPISIVAPTFSPISIIGPDFSPIMIEVLSLTPITIIGPTYTPITITGPTYTPISIVAPNLTPISVVGPDFSLTPISIVGPDFSLSPIEIIGPVYTPITIVGPTYTPISIVGVSLTPINVVGPTYTPISIVGPSYTPISIVGPNYTPISIVGPSYTPISIVGISLTPISVVGPSYTPISIIGPSYAPISIIGPSLTPISMVGPVLTPISIVGPTYTPISIVGPVLTPISVAWGPTPSIAPVSFTAAPTISVAWGTPPTVSCVVTVTCPSTTPMAAAMAGAESFNPDQGLTVDVGDIGIPSEIRVIAPKMPDLKLIHDLPVGIDLVVPNIPDIRLIGPEIPLPTEIRVVNYGVPSSIAVVSKGLPDSITLDATNVPKVIPIVVPDDFPRSIKLDATGVPTTIQVVGVPKSIELIAPSAIPLKWPDEVPEIPLVYKGSPIEMKISLDVQKLTGDGTNNKNACVMIVPCGT